MPDRILIIDDDYDMCLLLQRFLGKHGFDTTIQHKGQRGIATYLEQPFDAVICDYRLGDMDAVRVLNAIREQDPNVLFIVITGYSNTRTAVEIMKMGACDYIGKPLVPEELLNILRQSLARRNAVPTEPKATTTGRIKSPSIPGKQVMLSETSGNLYTDSQSDAMQNVYKLIAVVAPTNYNVILYGESGTGKEVAARMIHEQSLRRNRPFVAIDCGILSRELAASELFGHIKGAFTGAQQDREGHFALANGGTLFLDEVANLPGEVQTTLLRVIQERKFRPVGSGKEQNADVRIIVASNESLAEAHRKGRFREDLYYRFNEFMIHLPPLRQRKEDILPLAQLFMRQAAEETGSKPAGFDRSVQALMRDYPWPGNLRELRNLIRRAVLLTESGQFVTLDTFPPEFVDPEHWKSSDSTLSTEPVNVVDERLEASEPDLSAGESSLEKVEDVISEFDRLKGAASKAEYNAILQALKLANFNKKKAAAILKIDRKTLYNKLKNFRLRYSF